jgi:hypothetical protein
MNAVNIRRGIWLVVILLPLMAGAIQVREFIGSLRTSDGWYLAEQNDRVVLVAGMGEVAPETPGLKAVWRISAPHMQTPTGKFLAVEESESGVRLSLSAQKTIATRWKFEVVTSTSAKHPKTGSRDEQRMLVGTSSRTFRLRMFDGGHEGWYLAAEPRKDEAGKPSEVVREWRITEDPKQAVLFDYVDSHYSIGHK